MWSRNLLRTSRALALVGWLALTPVIAAQSQVTLDATQKKFADRAAAGDVKAVRALSKGRESSSVAALVQALAQARRAGDDLRLIRSLRKSLAALGGRDSRREIARELSSSHRYTQSYAFRDAAEIGGNDLISAIAEKLTDPSPGGRPVGPTGRVETDVGIAAPRHLAVIALSRLISDSSAPRIDLKRIRYRDEDVERWKIWWEANKTNYQAADLPREH